MGRRCFLKIVAVSCLLNPAETAADSPRRVEHPVRWDCKTGGRTVRVATVEYRGFASAREAMLWPHRHPELFEWEAPPGFHRVGHMATFIPYRGGCNLIVVSTDEATGGCGNG